MREELSANQSIVLTVVNLLAFAALVATAFYMYVDGGRIVVPSVLVVVPISYFVFTRSLAKIFIDHRFIYVKKFSREIRLRPDEIEDVDYWRFSNFLVLKFKRPTAFGHSVIFAPKGGQRTLDTALKGAEAFERIGRFCGWRK